MRQWSASPTDRNVGDKTRVRPGLHVAGTGDVWGRDRDPIRVSCILFILAYAVILSERVNRAIVSLVGAGLMISLGALNQATAIRGADFNATVLFQVVAEAHADVAEQARGDSIARNGAQDRLDVAAAQVDRAQRRVGSHAHSPTMPAHVGAVIEIAAVS